MSSRPLLSKSEGETPQINSRVSCGRVTQTLRVNWRPPPRRSRADGLAPASVGPNTFSTCLGEVSPTSIASRRGEGAGRDPWERVVVAMFPLSLEHFLDFWEGPVKLFSDRDAEPFCAGITLMLRRPFRSAACCLCLSRALTPADRSCTMIYAKQNKKQVLETL